MPIPKIRTKPKVGSEFEKKYRQKLYKLKVVRSAAGIGYELDGIVYSSPSTAAKTITKSEVNGWRFWGID